MSELTATETAHAQSVADPDDKVVLDVVPPLKQWKLLAATVARKAPPILAAWLAAVKGQRLRLNAQMDIAVILDDHDLPTHDQCRQLAEESGAKVLAYSGNGPSEFSDTGPSHIWTSNAFRRVAQLKNLLFQHALDNGYDAIWLVDTDVICDAYTLQNLVDTDNGIAAGVYWTRWTTDQHPLPQVWLKHPYQLHGHGYRDDEFLRLLVQRQRIAVGGLGACTLFHRAVLEKGVSFASVPEGLPPGPMADGEDRHLCERARRLHLPMVADAWPDIFHCYHSADQGKLADVSRRLGAEHPERARLGDLVSLRLTVLEPIVVAGRHDMLAPQYVRGRLGAMRIWEPQVENCVLNLEVGDHALLRLQYPDWLPQAEMRRQARILKVELLDAKPFTLAPGLQ